MCPSLLAPLASSRNDVVEAAEVREVGHVRHERLHARVERGTLRRPALRQPLVDLARQIGQRLDQQRRVAAGVVDVGLQQHAVARRLVDLDVEPLGEQPLELRCRRSRRAPHTQRQPGRIERELVVVPGVEQLLPGGVRLRRSPRCPTPGRPRAPFRPGVAMWKYFEISGCVVDLAPDPERDLDRAHRQLVAFELHLPARDVERRDDLLVRRGRRVREEGLLETALDDGGSRRPRPGSSTPAAAPTSTCASSRSGRRGCGPCRDPAAGACRAARGLAASSVPALAANAAYCAR